MTSSSISATAAIASAVFAILLFAAPAIAADWSFYGSQRIATLYTDRDYGDEPVNGQDDDQTIQWFFQGNSRLGARVKADKLRGRVELGLPEHLRPQR